MLSKRPVPARLAPLSALGLVADVIERVLGGCADPFTITCANQCGGGSCCNDPLPAPETARDLCRAGSRFCPPRQCRDLRSVECPNGCPDGRCCGDPVTPVGFIACQLICEKGAP